MALTRLKLNLGQIPALAKAVQAMVSVMVPCRAHARLPDPSISLCSRLTPLPPCFQAVTAVPSGIFTPTLGWAGQGQAASPGAGWSMGFRHCCQQYWHRLGRLLLEKPPLLSQMQARVGMGLLILQVTAGSRVEMFLYRLLCQTPLRDCVPV